MKISTSYLFDRAVTQMTNSQTSLAQSQAQLSAGKKVLSPSDAPDDATAIQRIKSVLARQDSFETSIQSTENRLKKEESALGGVSDVLTRLKELAVQASNDTYGAKDREALAIEMQGLQQDLLSFANTRDENGAYLFSGSRVTTPAFGADANGNIVYQGDETVNMVEVGDQRQIQGNRTGTQVFSRVVRTADDGSQQGVSFFQSVQDLVDAVRSSDRTKMNRGISEIDNLSQSVSLSVARVGSDTNVIQGQRAVLDETKLQLKTILSNAEDLDYTEAVTKMQKQMLALEASQSGFAKISQLNLFQYLR
ncbi:MAG: flagellar hook-associated protein 3 [Betaproteobacteria bacterium]|nr:flagellar hook-associated protein 3 [Betaproteobacteria bacterium]NBT75619.1 flagellar hook-associated protein 3 [Betaproteobacteria bacterium]NBY14440.1 flagellar hook-associated protein 3 [Betaproteobacteria bacterium]NCA16067.1 flagellar hook-associated protein 3 [Betaproteobacteria bacterium]